jgi:hypothetical protein
MPTSKTKALEQRYDEDGEPFTAGDAGLLPFRRAVHS